MSSWQEGWEVSLRCTCCLKVKVEVKERPKLDSTPGPQKKARQLSLFSLPLVVLGPTVSVLLPAAVGKEWSREDRLVASGPRESPVSSLFCILLSRCRRKAPKLLLCQGEKEGPLRSAEEGGSRGNPPSLPSLSQTPPSYLTQTAKQPSFLPRVRLTEFQL